MDRRSNPLSSEDRGVILAEDLRGGIQRAIGARLGRAASTICRELARGRQDDGAYPPNQRGRFTTFAGHDVGAAASSPAAARPIPFLRAQPSRSSALVSRADCAETSVHASG